MFDFDEYVLSEIIAAFDASPVAVSIDRERLQAIVALIKKQERRKCVEQIQSIKNTPSAEYGKTLLDAVINIIDKD